MELDGGAVFVKSNEVSSTHKLHVLSTRARCNVDGAMEE